MDDIPGDVVHQSVKEPLFLLSENRGITIFGYKYE